MGGFLLRKVGAALIVLVLASMLVFVGVRAIPGDPAVALGAENRDPAVLAAIRHKYGLDKPVPVQYVNWVSLAVRGDLGTDQRELSVSRTIVQRLPITLELAGLAILIGSLIGIVAGVLAAVRRGKPADYAATTVALVGLSVPHFWLGILMIIYFAVQLHWLPAGGYVPFSQNPVQNIYLMKTEKKGGAYQNTVIATYPNVSQFWTWTPEAFMAMPSYSELKGKWVK